MLKDIIKQLENLKVREDAQKDLSDAIFHLKQTQKIIDLDDLEHFCFCCDEVISKIHDICPKCGYDYSV